MDISLKLLREKLDINKRSFALSIGVDEGVYSKLESGKLTLTKTYIDKIKSKYPEYSDYNISNLNQGAGKHAIIQYYEHVDAICGVSDFKNMQEQHSYPISVPGAREGDFCINAKGQSLSGIIESGTIIGLRPVKDLDLIVYGELYFVCTEGFERAKIIMPGTDKKHVILKSTDDDKFPPVEIPKSKITALYKIWYKGELL